MSYINILIAVVASILIGIATILLKITSNEIGFLLSVVIYLGLLNYFELLDLKKLVAKKK